MILFLAPETVSALLHVQQYFRTNDESQTPAYDPAQVTDTQVKTADPYPLLYQDLHYSNQHPEYPLAITLKLTQERRLSIDEVCPSTDLTPLMLAVSRQLGSHVLKHIVKLGASIKITNQAGYTALDLAVVENNFEAFTYLMDWMQYFKDRIRTTCLLAAAYGRTDMLRVAQQKGYLPLSADDLFQYISMNLLPTQIMNADGQVLPAVNSIEEINDSCLSFLLAQTGATTGSVAHKWNPVEKQRYFTAACRRGWRDILPALLSGRGLNLLFTPDYFASLTQEVSLSPSILEYLKRSQLFSSTHEARAYAAMGDLKRLQAMETGASLVNCYIAAARHDHEHIMAYLDKNIPADMHESDIVLQRRLALHVALTYGKELSIRYLIREVKILDDIKASVINKDTPNEDVKLDPFMQALQSLLYIAVEAGRSSVVLLLLDSPEIRNAHIAQCTTDWSKSACDHAAKLGHITMMRYLYAVPEVKNHVQEHIEVLASTIQIAEDKENIGKPDLELLNFIATVIEPPDHASNAALSHSMPPSANETATASKRASRV